jgi:hypothetical protein
MQQTGQDFGIWAQYVQPMESVTTISGLIRKRAEIAGQLEEDHKVVCRLTLDLNNLDATILIFDPDAKLEAAA